MLSSETRTRRSRFTGRLERESRRAFTSVRYMALFGIDLEITASEALGREFSPADFEKVMSTHYGRIVVLDDKVVMFANPEDAAEYIDFDLEPVN